MSADIYIKTSVRSAYANVYPKKVILRTADNPGYGIEYELRRVTREVPCSSLGNTGFIDNNPAADTITRSSGSWVTDGVISGSYVKFTKSGGANTGKTYTVSNVTAGTLTVSEDVVAEVATSGYTAIIYLDRTCTSVGNLTFADVGAADTITRTSGSWISDGIYTSCVVKFAKAGGANDGLACTITDVTHTVLTTSTAVTAEADASGYTATMGPTGMSTATGTAPVICGWWNYATYCGPLYPASYFPSVADANSGSTYTTAGTFPSNYPVNYYYMNAATDSVTWNMPAGLPSGCNKVVVYMIRATTGVDADLSVDYLGDDSWTSEATLNNNGASNYEHYQSVTLSGTLTSVSKIKITSTGADGTHPFSLQHMIAHTSTAATDMSTNVALPPGESILVSNLGGTLEFPLKLKPNGTSFGKWFTGPAHSAIGDFVPNSAGDANSNGVIFNDSMVWNVAGSTWTPAAGYTNDFRSLVQIGHANMDNGTNSNMATYTETFTFTENAMQYNASVVFNVITDLVAGYMGGDGTGTSYDFTYLVFPDESRVDGSGIAAAIALDGNQTNIQSSLGDPIFLVKELTRIAASGTGLAIENFYEYDTMTNGRWQLSAVNSVAATTTWTAGFVLRFLTDFRRTSVRNGYRKFRWRDAPYT